MIKRLLFTLLFALYASPLILNAQSIPFDVTLASKAAIRDYAISRAMINGAPIKKTLAIIEAESEFNINAHNGSSTATGLAQFLSGTFKWMCIDLYKVADSMFDKNEPHVQIECLTKALADGKESHWLESKPKWKKLLISM